MASAFVYIYGILISSMFYYWKNGKNTIFPWVSKWISIKEPVDYPPNAAKLLKDSPALQDRSAPVVCRRGGEAPDKTRVWRVIRLPLVIFYYQLDEGSFQEIWTFAKKMLSLFDSTCLCEKTFSIMNTNKSCVRMRLCDFHLPVVYFWARPGRQTAVKISVSPFKLAQTRYLFSFLR